MATYIYNYQRVGKGEMIAKYADGYIYDLRGKRYASDSDIIGKTIGEYLKIYRRQGYEYTDITVKGNVAYKDKNYYLVAKNNVIYSKNNIELAEYEGNAQEALFAYAALQIERESITSKNYVNQGYSKSNTTSDNSSGGSFGCGPWLVFLGMFIICGFYILLSEHFYEYYTVIHIAIPALIIFGIIIKRMISGEEHEYYFFDSICNFIIGVLIGLVIIFFVGSFDMFIHSIIGEHRDFVISIDAAYSTCILEIGIISILCGAEKKQKMKRKRKH